MWKFVQLVLLAVYCIAGTGIESVCPERATLEEARICCHKRGQFLPSPLTKRDNANLSETLSTQNKSSSWLDIYQSGLPYWTWIDGTVEVSIEVKGTGCGLYNSTSQNISSAPCGSSQHGAVCGVKECRSCYKLGSLSRICHRFGNTCYLYLCEDNNWFAASSLCRSLGYTLAGMNHLRITILTKRYTCDTFWVGLRKEDWIYHEKNKSLGETGASAWKNSYIYSKGNCSQFFVTKHGYEWQRQKCETRHTYICLPGENPKTSIGNLALTSLYTISPKSTKAMNDSDPGIKPLEIAYLSIGISALLGLISVPVTIIIWHFIKRRNKRERKRNYDEALDQQREKIPLKSTENISPEFDGAVHIVECDRNTGVLNLNYAQLASVLSNPAFNDPECKIVVLSIAGPFRTGKSFLMNYILRYLLARQTEDSWTEDKDAPLEGFKWDFGSPVTTLGIWIWSEPIRLTFSDSSKVCILLMDTQGLYELDNRARQSATLTTLSCLISSMQIYNILTEVSEEDLERLNVLGRAAKILLDGDKCLEDTDNKPVQHLTFLVRDWSDDELPYTYGSEGGKSYLNWILSGKNISQKQRLLRNEISKKVNELDCFLMPHPGQLAIGGRKEYNGNLAGLSQEFRHGLNDLFEHLFHETRIRKMYRGNKYLSGSDLCRHIMLYVTAFNADRCAVPVSTVDDLLSETNKLAFKRAVKGFSESLYELMRNSETLIDSGSEEIRQMKSSALQMYNSLAIPHGTSEVYRKNMESILEIITPKRSGNEGYRQVMHAVSYYIDQMKSFESNRNITTHHKESQRKACDMLVDRSLRRVFMKITNRMNADFSSGIRK